MVSARLVMLMLAVDAQVAAAYDSSGLKDGERSGELATATKTATTTALISISNSLSSSNNHLITGFNHLAAVMTCLCGSPSCKLSVFRSRKLPCIGLMLFDDAGEAALLASVKMNRLMHSESENFLKVVGS